MIEKGLGKVDGSHIYHVFDYTRQGPWSVSYCTVMYEARCMSPLARRWPRWPREGLLNPC